MTLCHRFEEIFSCEFAVCSLFEFCRVFCCSLPVSFGQRKVTMTRKSTFPGIFYDKSFSMGVDLIHITILVGQRWTKHHSFYTSFLLPCFSIARFPSPNHFTQGIQDVPHPKQLFNGTVRTYMLQAPLFFVLNEITNFRIVAIYCLLVM